LLFLLNHRDESVHVAASVCGTDLLSGNRFRLGERITLAPRGVVILQLQ
jgi:hypothetical protein